MNRRELLECVTAHYLGSRDFNGLSVHALVATDGPSDLEGFLKQLTEEPDAPADEAVDLIRELVEDGSMTVVFGDVHPNPHIRAFPDEPKDVTLAKLSAPNLKYACLLPYCQALADRREPSRLRWPALRA